MTTIHPMGMASLIADHRPFDLIDVRSRAEFDKLHIPGARSVPLKKLSPALILRERRLAASEPLFVICRNRVLATLAAGMLRGVGCSQPVVVDGGMETWETQGLPAIRTRNFCTTKAKAWLSPHKLFSDN